jgi:ABC-2 type transport system permease protein
VAAGRGDLVGAFTGLAGFFLLTFGFFVFCVLVADNLYAAGWVRMQSSGSARRTRQRAQQAASRRGLMSRASAELAIMLKDWRVIPRDLRNFAQMLAPLLFLPVIYLNILGDRRGSNPLSGMFGRGNFDPSGVLIAGGILFASAAVLGRVADTSISREGKSWWLLKVAPVSASEVIRSKFLAAFIPFVVLSTLLMIGATIWKGFGLFGTLYGLFGILVLGAGMLAIETGLGVPWARLDWDDPRRMSSGWGAMATLVAWALLGIVGGGALCLPIIAEIADPSLVPWATLLGVILSSAVSLGSGLAALMFGVSRLWSVGEA